MYPTESTIALKNFLDKERGGPPLPDTGSVQILKPIVIEAGPDDKVVFTKNLYKRKKLDALRQQEQMRGQQQYPPPQYPYPPPQYPYPYPPPQYPPYPPQYPPYPPQYPPYPYPPPY